MNADLGLAQIGPGSHKVVFWRCDDGHVWQAQVHFRVAGTRCPHCAGYVPYGRTTLSEHSPCLVAEWRLAPGPAAMHRPGVWPTCPNCSRWWSPTRHRPTWRNYWSTPA
ncbi:zinc-ribbon domain-containing protein [Streptomyces sp. NPDC006259]|uniref:zinc-ribbon domain-containing protein n=1 Tax=Streptomyces sp. NPDC006259 TaxID=3364740 RepID=UPI0036AE55BD